MHCRPFTDAGEPSRGGAAESTRLAFVLTAHGQARQTRTPTERRGNRSDRATKGSKKEGCLTAAFFSAACGSADPAAQGLPFARAPSSAGPSRPVGDGRGNPDTAHQRRIATERADPDGEQTGQGGEAAPG